MNITVEIDNTRVVTKEGTSKKGQPYRIREQSCVVHGCGRFPQESKVRVPDDVEFYAVGRYVVNDLVQVGRYGFEVGRDYYLTPVEPGKQAAKAA